MIMRYIAGTLLASTLIFGYAGSAAAMSQVGVGNLNATTTTRSDHLHRVHGWWWAVPVIIGGAIILDHHYYYRHHHYRHRYCRDYRC